MVKAISFRTLSNVFHGTFFRYPFYSWPLTVVTKSSIIDCGLGPKCTYVCTFWLEFNFYKMGVNISVKMYWFTVTQKTRILNRGVATGLIRRRMAPHFNFRTKEGPKVSVSSIRYIVLLQGYCITLDFLKRSYT